MRRLVANFLIFCFATALTPISVLANGGVEKSLDEIRADIRALEAVERAPETLPEVVALNRELLKGKRKELYSTLGRRKGAFENYLRTVGTSLDPRELQKVQTYINDIESEMRDLDELLASAESTKSRTTDHSIVAQNAIPPSQATGSRMSSSAAQSQSPVQARFLPVAGATGITVSDNLTPPEESTLSAPATPVVDTSCPSCLPSNPPDEKKDFIINARTGETSGKKRFGLRDNARIIVIEKNPFLYEYRVTLKDKPIIESAIAEFFGNFSLFVEALKPKATGSQAPTINASCPPFSQQLQLQFNTLSNLQRLLERDDSSAPRTTSLRNRFTEAKEAYNKIAPQVDGAKKVLYDQDANCTTLCSTATSIRSTIQNYKPDIQQLTNDIALFKVNADAFQRGVLALDEALRNSSTTGVTSECFTIIDDLRRNAAAYMETSKDMETGIQKITTGKKAFDTIVKTINNVFSNPNAFHQVYSRGEYSLPTDVEITVERKDLTKEDAAFVKLVEGQTVNFGGGARFAIAGGVVASPLETINYKRVPALINGQSATVVGKDEGSNSRILPMLMLHGRLAGGNWAGPVSGIHLSIGITAKPNDTGTNVEFLLGPSVSFVEERLFLTFGGYAGRRKQLEGNLVEGQELPTAFSEDIPTSNHLIWKPGVALTYKFK